MILIFDIEATGAQRNKAHPYDARNKMCNIGFYNPMEDKIQIFKIEYDEEPYGDKLKEIQEILNKCTLVVGANLKFDIAWLHRYKLYLPTGCRVFDITSAFFILTCQKIRYPSLDGMAEYFGLPQKLDVVKVEYWEKGFDTDEIPYDILEKYLKQDLIVTFNVYQKICNWIDKQEEKTKKLISMTMQDLLVLQDIEDNGILIDTKKSLRKGDELVKRINEIDNWLRKVFGADWFNPNSGDHLSIFLYGGTLMLDGKEEYTFTYKDGRTTQKIRNVKIPFTYKGLFKPLEKTELAKEGFYATNESTLIKLAEKAKKEPKIILETLLKRAKLEKLRSTYYHGLPAKIPEMGWTDNIIHSSFNQNVAQSGRLSSTKPNVQNLADEIKEIFITRFH